MGVAWAPALMSERLDDVPMSLRRRHVQGRVTALVLAIQISPGADERFRHLHIPFVIPFVTATCNGVMLL